jgi:hypothetical protein
VAACVDCNGGKSAMRPDEPLIEGPSEEAIRSVRAARDVVSYLFGTLPQRTDRPEVRAMLANRFMERFAEDPDFGVDASEWSRDLMTFAQAVTEMADALPVRWGA